jgi:hypothetical protein
LAAVSNTSTIVFALQGPIASKDIRAMCERVGSLLDATGTDVICDVGAVARPDGGTVEAGSPRGE